MKNKNSKIIIALLYLLGLSFPITVFYYIYVYAIDIPYWDQWVYIPIFDLYLEGKLTFYDLWQQHLDHRLFFPRLIMLISGIVTDWNTRNEALISVMITCMHFLLLLTMGKKLITPSSRQMKALIFTIISMVTFSLQQGENWFWGWNIQIMLNSMAISATLFSMHLWIEKKWTFWIATIFTTIAVYSYSNGLLLIGFGFIVLAIQRYLYNKKTKGLLVNWSVFSALLLASFFYGFTKTALPAEKLTLLEYCYKAPVYFFAYLGSPIAHFSLVGASISGGIGFILFIMTSVYFAFKRKQFSHWIPFYFLGLYSLGTAFLTAYGRVNLGLEQALSERYVAFSIFLWLYLFLFAIHYIIQAKTNKKQKIAIAAVLAVMAIGFFLSHIQSKQLFIHRSARLQTAKRVLQFGGNREKLYALCWDLKVLDEMHPLLEKHKLSFYRITKKGIIHPDYNKLTSKPYDAVITGCSIPESIKIGTTCTASITVMNTGQKPWNTNHGIKLGASENHDPIAAGFCLRRPLRKEIQPGEIVHFFLEFAPDTPGIFQTDWQMLIEGKTWFGEKISQTVEVE